MSKTNTPDPQPDAVSFPSPNHGPRRAGARIDTVILHYTGMKTGEEALQRLCDTDAQVSCHWLIDEDGTLYKLVDEHRRAWHAGVSHWDGERDINSRSIGIELVNPGHEHGYRSFPAPQMATLKALLQGIKSRHPVPAERIIGHSDVAPGRKVDPGELFPWQELAAEGLGIWPDAEALKTAPGGLPVGEVQARLKHMGYDCPVSGQLCSASQQIIREFQRRFTPQHMTGQPARHMVRALVALTQDYKPQPAFPNP